MSWRESSTDWTRTPDARLKAAKLVSNQGTKSVSGMYHEAMNTGTELSDHGQNRLEVRRALCGKDSNKAEWLKLKQAQEPVFRRESKTDDHGPEQSRLPYFGLNRWWGRGKIG